LKIKKKRKESITLKIKRNIKSGEKNDMIILKIQHTKRKSLKSGEKIIRNM
jgi:hypothetical protein